MARNSEARRRQVKDKHDPYQEITRADLIFINLTNLQGKVFKQNPAPTVVYPETKT